MQIEAIYHHGTLQFKAPLHFRQQHFKVTVDIPEPVIAEPIEISLPTFDLSLFSPAVRAEIARLEAIQQQVLGQAINSIAETETEEERIRWAAFELRNESRREQGRKI